MRITYILILLITSFNLSYGQWNWSINFENDYYIDQLFIDTVNYPNNKWQIGHPNKIVFDSSYSNPNSIVTDTLYTVPSNDTSVFILFHERTQGAPFHWFDLSFLYCMDGDTTDYGIIEISGDGGETWINSLIQDEIYGFIWYPSKPKLNGKTNGWKELKLEMWSWASLDTLLSDTILIRITYITDSLNIDRDGWMIDDISINDMWEAGIKENSDNNSIQIFPNPAKNFLNIITYKEYVKAKIQIIDITGKIVYIDDYYNKDVIDISELKNGLYILKYSFVNDYSVLKFVINK